MSPASLVRLFARHRNAGNLLMILALVGGFIAMDRLNRQFLPSVGLDFIQIVVDWPGASAEDVEDGIVQALEPEVRFLDGLKKLTSTANEGVAALVLEFETGTDMQAALADAESAVARLTTLPEDAEEPEIARIVLYETVGRLAVYGPFPEAELKGFAETIRDDLIARGIDRIDLFGARDEEIVVEVAPETLLRLDLTLSDLARRLATLSQDVPLGSLEGGLERQLRSLERRTDAASLGELTVLGDGGDGGRLLRLTDIARVTDGFDEDESVGQRDGQPAIELEVQRALTADSLEAAAILTRYLEEQAEVWPPGLVVEPFDTLAELIEDRIALLIKNGAGGLVLVLAVLFLFLSARVAFWIALGIPIAIMAAAVVMLATGQSLNMLSLFGIIMALGIVVDDAIVVGEHAVHRSEDGLSPLDAAEQGALAMLAPVTAATLTTVAAFLPLLIVGNIIGQIISAIPIVIISILIASLIECFLILPAHMRNALSKEDIAHHRQNLLRRRFDSGFDAFRRGPFRRIVLAAISWRYATIAAAVACFMLAIGVIAGDRVGFRFFPSPESEIILADFAFTPGTPRETTQAMIAEAERALTAVEARFAERTDGPLVASAFARIGQGAADFPERGDHIGSLLVQLPPADFREVRTAEFIAAWEEEIRPLAGLDRRIIRERIGGPPGRALDVRLSGGTLDELKAAALEVTALLGRYPGISGIADDMPYGRPETVLELTARGRALGFTAEGLALQVRGAFEGIIADRFARGDDEVTVRVRFTAQERGLAGLEDLRLRTPDGAGEVALGDIVTFREERGFLLIRRENGVREVAVTAEVDAAQADVNAVLADLPAAGLDRIAEDYDIDYRFAGKAEEQAETLADMRLGAMIGLAMIYIILAWVFASYGRPIVVMSVIPFGMVGAVLGHLLLGFDLTILSMIALLGLSGILVNDSIILVTTIDRHLAMPGKGVRQAVVDGTCERLRPVLLTSLTTIGGLTPLLFETSLQAQFLIPMAITLVFGLMVTTFLVLLVVPALITIQEDGRKIARRLAHRLRRTARRRRGHELVSR